MLTWSLTLAITFVCFLQTNAIKLVTTNVVYKYVNPEYFDVENCRVSSNRVNVTYATISGKCDVIKTLPEDTLIHGNVYAVIAGIPIQTGLVLHDNICKVLANPPKEAGIIFDDIGFTADDCPPNPGVHEITDYYFKIDVPSSITLRRGTRVLVKFLATSPSVGMLFESELTEQIV